MVDLTDEKMRKGILAKLPDEEINIAPLQERKTFDDIRKIYFEMPKMAKADVHAKMAKEFAEEQFADTFGVRKDQLITLDNLFRESIRVRGDEIRKEGFAGKWALAYASARADVGTLQPECLKCVQDLNEKLWEYYHKADIEVGRVETAKEMEERMKDLDKTLQELKKTASEKVI